MSLASADNLRIINAMKAQYCAGVIWADDSYTQNVEISSGNTGFLGSGGILNQTSKGDIVHEAPGCAAAPIVNMVARKSVVLGGQGKGQQPFPTRIYAPQQLSISANEIVIGDLNVIVEPANAFLMCKKLRLVQLSAVNEKILEVVQTWVSDTTEIVRGEIG